MSESDFDPANVDSSSEEVLPFKREKPEFLSENLSLPDPLALLEDFKSLSKPAKRVKKNEKKDFSAVISKKASLNKLIKDDIDQYDYFASETSAILDHWKAPQDLPDPFAVADRSKFIKNLKPRQPVDIAAKLQREFDHVERIKKGKRQFQKDQERKMRQQFDS
jgi:hypothetical protein